MTGNARKAILLNALVAALAKVMADGRPQYCRKIADRMETVCNTYGWGN